MKGANKTVRVGAGLGFYGDSWRPVRASIERGGVQYIASDHLSELTLAILQKDRQRDKPGDAASGYARDAVPMLLELWPLAAKHKVRFVLNAGGLNPEGARQAIAKAFRDRGWKAKIATVTGDSVLERIDELRAAGKLREGSNTAAFALVGYGDTITFPPPEFAFFGQREVAYSAYLGLLPSWLHMSQNQATDDGGTCYGDSGGPAFWTEPDGSEIVVGVTSWGDIPCVASSFNYRIDTADSLDFIQDVIDSLESAP